MTTRIAMGSSKSLVSHGMWEIAPQRPRQSQVVSTLDISGGSPRYGSD